MIVFDTPGEKVVYEEAMRLVPALAMTRVRDSIKDCSDCYAGYLATARENGVTEAEAWETLAITTHVWVTQLFTSLARERGEHVEEHITGAIEAALEWVDAGVR